ncbi:hypothetical protein [Algoriphagus terrigena]|uniref:hypothetical protein n=1 Tax=Algoriphagus terrigena TaxID=344884 RepID=UPI000552FF77|nr:hypothetical protein [Algoriphagus terrigena]
MGTTSIKLLLCAALSVMWFYPSLSPAQSQEAAQLVLNFEKLNQLRQILKDMQRGYTVLEKGYSAVKDITEGNFRLHEAFLDGLLEVSPEVRKYHRLAGLIRLQERLVSDYHSGLRRLQFSGEFSGDEIAQQRARYTRIYRLSLRNLEELALILSAGSLRMGDFERLEAIDRLYGEMQGLLGFLGNLNRDIDVLIARRQERIKEQTRISTLYP